MTVCKHGPIEVNERCSLCDDEMTVVAYVDERYQFVPGDYVELLGICKLLAFTEDMGSPRHPAAVFDAARRVVAADGGKE